MATSISSESTQLEVQAYVWSRLTGRNVVTQSDIDAAILAFGLPKIIPYATAPQWLLNPQPTVQYAHPGSVLWDMLHRYPVDHANNWSVDDAFFFFKIWRSRVDQMGLTFSCGCGGEATGIINDVRSQIEYEADSTVFSTVQLFFEFSVALHNQVNVKLGKNVVELSHAKTTWGMPDPEPPIESP